ncbi:MAG: hypothetical protein Q8L60_14290 [Gammaproteobacteria bacterium]|nr:hypothetical protein [Gammaproteobacteria bacterium]MDP2139567.1 hypothetical protein [Gammaproteobacteria bacterium]MDP2346540.1 hypothetical protein [Gammaproteobacteria bacterium]
MKDRYVLDTNVLIAASAVSSSPYPHPQHTDTTPPEDEMRQRILSWLQEFERSDARLVLDAAGEIEKEYHHKLGFNDYGLQVIRHKWESDLVDIVTVDYDADGNGIVPQPLDGTVHDLADRKMVAAAVAALSLPGTSAVAFAGDTDWHDWEHELKLTGLTLEPIIEEWSRSKHKEKVLRQHHGRHTHHEHTTDQEKQHD